ncbi:signal transduction histidine kinase/CheY-like chemotaxis protein [Variovorax boronicumulans]|uniref:ATP-binding response regulator n=1 Tax=Variovorax boronicumulans TaxID=436515 RepID=UPI0027813D26|nr:hybrid sensor histidine kinase/response regulator [Variovorax boronicumulans]MDQ0014139.1 signal transduction histidine kinase/CheY-like chemotaxis protein [Variovorax boronicumulans]
MASSDPSADHTLGQRVLREHVASVYDTYIVSTLTHMAFVVVFGCIIYSQLRNLSLLFWIGGLVIADIYVFFTPRWTPLRPARESAYWARKISRMVTLVSMITAVVPWLIVPYDNLPMTSLLMAVIVGSCARAAQSLWPLKSALFGYTLPMSLGLITALAWQGDGLHLFLAAAGAAYLLLTLRAGIGQHRLLTESLMLRFENEALAARLGEQIAATERASEEKTRFLGTASHDLRQPLHAIALFGAALENELRDRPEGRNAERLMRAVNALGASLDTMLDVSRLDAGVITPVPQPVQLDALFLPLNHTFSARAEQKQLQLRVRASGLWVHSDPQLLHRMLSNLMDNALKYTAHGGVTVIARERGDSVWVEVRDTGIGIAAEQSGRIFEEFYQINNPGRDRSRGLGIGLSIVQRLSRLLGHPVQMHSRPGRGTHFRVVLPAARAQAGGLLPSSFPSETADASQQAPQRRVAAPLPGRVLLLDDELEIREAMMGLLRSHAIDAHAVADEAGAAAALQKAHGEGRPFDLLLCDYRLADGVDGLDAGLRLSQGPGEGRAEIPLLLITGETSPARLQRVRESQVPVLFKPVVAAALLQAMAELTAAKPAAEPSLIDV